MTKNLLTFATLNEAQASIDVLGAMQSQTDLFNVNTGAIVITGIGNRKATHALSSHIHSYDKVYNLGVAGSLKNHPIGSVFHIYTLEKFVHMPKDTEENSIEFSKNVFPKLISEDNNGINLLTSDFPIHNDRLQSKLQENYDLVDMEGYAILFTAQKHQKPCQIIKIVSDFCKFGGEKTVKKHIDYLSNGLAGVAMSLVS